MILTVITLAVLLHNTAITIAAWSRADDAYAQALLGNVMLDDHADDIHEHIERGAGPSVTEITTTLDRLMEDGLVPETDDTGELETFHGLTIEELAPTPFTGTYNVGEARFVAAGDGVITDTRPFYIYEYKAD
jgi:hypothetical protein